MKGGNEKKSATQEENCNTTTHQTKRPVHLYFCDVLQCVESLFNHPYFADKMDLSPFCLFTTAECLVRVYTEWMSSDGAWDMQVGIPTFCSFDYY